VVFSMKLKNLLKCVVMCPCMCKCMEVIENGGMYVLKIVIMSKQFHDFSTAY
jgi:hypothetical protein